MEPLMEIRVPVVIPGSGSWCGVQDVIINNRRNAAPVFFKKFIENQVLGTNYQPLDSQSDTPDNPEEPAKPFSMAISRMVMRGGM